MSIHLRYGLPTGLFPAGFLSNILYAFLFFPICVICPGHLILLDLITLIILGEEYKLWRAIHTLIVYCSLYIGIKIILV
jgi:hypothetical protein